VARIDRDIEWLPPEDDENGAESFAIRPVDFTVVSQLGAHLSASRRLTAHRARQILAALTLIVLFGVVARIGVRDGRPAFRAEPPHWLQRLPLTEPLSPFMAPECWRTSCPAVAASGLDLEHIRAGLGAQYVVTSDRILDQRGNVRGTAIDVMDGQGDNLTIDAVRVTRAPAYWDGQANNLLSDTPVRRWVLHGRSGVWLVESRVSRGSCDHDEKEYLVLYKRALARVTADQIRL
jgi:hypothetical protein